MRSNPAQALVGYGAWSSSCSVTASGKAWLQRTYYCIKRGGTNFDGTGSPLWSLWMDRFAEALSRTSILKKCERYGSAEGCWSATAIYGASSQQWCDSH